MCSLIGVGSSDFSESTETVDSGLSSDGGGSGHHPGSSGNFFTGLFAFPDADGLSFDAFLSGEGGDGGGGSEAAGLSLQLLRPGYTYGLYAYALTLEGAKKLLASRPLRKMIPSDDFISVLCDTHPVLEYRKW